MNSCQIIDFNFIVKNNKILKFTQKIKYNYAMLI